MIKPVLLCIGPGGSSTGYSRVLDTLMGNIYQTFDVTHFAINLARYPAKKIPYRLICNQLLGDIFGREQLPRLLEEVKPDLVLLCHDPGFWEVHRIALQTYQKSFKHVRTVFYCPIEWKKMFPGVISSLSGMDKLVVYTKFAQQVVKSICLQNNFSLPPISVIPHGIDHEVFYPLVKDDVKASRILARQKLFPDRPELHEAFIVLNANRNVKRKRIDLSLQAFSNFIKTNPSHDIYLYLHMGMQDFGWDILSLAKELKINDRLLLTTSKDDPPRVNDAYLNLIYNACNVGINTSTGEGWGLVAVEHAACGGIQIVPNHSACAELWKEYGVLIPLDSSPTAAYGQISVANLTEVLNKLYLHPEEQEKLSALALKFANQPSIHWKNIARQWKMLLIGLTNSSV